MNSPGLLSLASTSTIVALESDSVVSIQISLAHGIYAGVWMSATCRLPPAIVLTPNVVKLVDPKKKKKDDKVRCKRDLESHASHLPAKSVKILRNAY